MEAHTYDDRSFLMQSFLSHRRFVVIFLFDRVEERRGEERRGEERGEVLAANKFPEDDDDNNDDDIFVFGLIYRGALTATQSGRVVVLTFRRIIRKCLLKVC